VSKGKLLTTYAIRLLDAISYKDNRQLFQ